MVSESVAKGDVGEAVFFWERSSVGADFGVAETDLVFVLVVVEVSILFVAWSLSRGVYSPKARARDGRVSSEIAVDATSGTILGVLWGESTYREWVLYVDSK